MLVCHTFLLYVCQHFFLARNLSVSLIFFLSFCVSVLVSCCSSVCQFTFLVMNISACLPVYLPVVPLVPQFLYLSVRTPVAPSFPLFFSLSFFLFVCLSVSIILSLVSNLSSVFSLSPFVSFLSLTSSIFAFLASLFFFFVCLPAVTSIFWTLGQSAYLSGSLSLSL